MLINREHRAWAVITVLATAGFLFLFLAKYHPAVLPIKIQFPIWIGPEVGPGRKVGATLIGLGYGILAFFIFLFAAALGLRKKIPILRIGSARFWLKGHIWLTILTIPLVIMHANAKLGAPMTFWLIVLYALVMISGFYGVALQQVLPRLMKERLPLETVFEQIPYLKDRIAQHAVELHETILKEQAQFREDAQKAAAPHTAEAGGEKAATISAPPAPVLDQKTDDSFRALIGTLEKEVLPYLMVKKTTHLAMSQQAYSDQTLRLLKLSAIPDHRLWAEQMESWCDERRSMNLQTKYQHWLHSWLLFHVPLSFVLIGYTVWHALVALFYY